MQATRTGITVPGQIVESLITVGVYFLVLFTAEVVYSMVRSRGQRLVSLVETTVDSSDKMMQIRQDIRKYRDAKPIGLSVNERTGIEFAYSFFLYVEPRTFSSGTEVFKHVFHKGYSEPWPLMGPGVFISGKTNTMRIVMNTYKAPFTYVDVTNIPVEKWFHVVINCYKGGLDVFVNGYLANRLNFADSIPYQNYGDVYLFLPQSINTIRGPAISAMSQGDMNMNFDIEGAFSGFLSRLTYARYALSTPEIQSLLNAGPSKEIEKKNMQEPPYLADNWWTTQS